MTKKDIFAHKLFLLLNISDVDLYLCENCNPSPESIQPHLSQQTPFRSSGPVKSLPPFENLDACS